MFDELIISYLFLGGVGAGACAVLSCMGLFVPRSAIAVLSGDEGRARRGDRARFVVRRPPASYRKLFVPAYVCAVGVLFLGVVCLATDHGSIDKLILLVVRPELTYVTIGAYSLAACIVLAVLMACLWGGAFARVSHAVFRAACVCMFAVSIVVMVYTGLLLRSLRAVALWDSLWLPILFVLSAVSCGIALVTGTAKLLLVDRPFAVTLRRLLVADVAVIILEMLAVALLVASTWVQAVHDGSSGTAQAAMESVRALVTGEVALPFWGYFVGIGAIVPLIAELTSLHRRSLSWRSALFVSGCILVGGFAMRYCIVEAGLHPVLFAVGLGA